MGGKPRQKAISHLVIPDLQVKPGINLDHFDWIGRYIADRRPEVIVQIGDWADMQSLSSFDKGKGKGEGKRVSKDLEVFEQSVLQLESHFPAGYRPRKVFTCGNHEERIDRFQNDNPNIDIISHPMDYLESCGWEVHPFLSPVTINGVSYCHFFPRTARGTVSAASSRNGAPNALAQVKANDGSTVAGHKQGFDIAPFPGKHRLRWAIIAGSCYQHKEGYLGPQGNNHYRGLVLLNRVRGGGFDPCLVSLDYLKEKYSK